MDRRDLSTGLAGLDQIIGGVLPGDNVVWQVDSIDDYVPFVEPYCERALKTGKTLVYFRFATHQRLVPEGSGAIVYRLHPEDGFESFLHEVHRVIEKSGRGAFYVFDCLSELVVDWYSDQMLANFFLLTCPYLFDLHTVTYFPLLRKRHSSYATSPITETTQLLLAVYRRQDTLYLRPLKVLHRYSATMYMLHAWQGDQFVPVTQSALASDILASAPWPQMQSGGAHLDIWNRTFADARAALQNDGQGEDFEQRTASYLRRILRMAITREARMLELCEKYLSLQDLLAVGDRMVGTGLIGGKSVGMLLARAILTRAGQRWDELLERHDSFFIASDVFYTYLVRNGCWWGRESLKNSDSFLRGASEVRRQILRGTFPEALVRQFSDMLAYFGQSPIIVRSSSLLEDSFGHAFAGKYESVFCANQGSEGKRIEDFLSAVRTIYASAMSEDALQYRAQRGLLDRDEQMALLVQRVSGSMNGNLFYPHMAGVGFSFNPFAWDPAIDPEAGVLRLVFGLGTRAVDRSDDDYTRLVALNAPHRRPECTSDKAAKRGQRKVDVLDLGANLLVSTEFVKVARQSPGPVLESVASRDPEIERYARQRELTDVFPWVLDFQGALRNTSFVEDMREMLSVLSRAYQYPVDVEFTANMISQDRCMVNLVQCRPLQVRGVGEVADLPENLGDEDVVLRTRGAVIGHSRVSAVDRVVYVVPELYDRLPHQSRFAVARLIGEITRLEMPQNRKTILLVGPGRWGTSTPSLGVPVSFSQISPVSVICEVVAMRQDLVPDVSLGTHFLSDLVELDMLYLALFPTQEGNKLNRRFFEEAPSRLSQLLPDTGADYLQTVRVIDADDLSEGRGLRLYANTLEQECVCYLD